MYLNINMQISKIIEQNKVKKEPQNKKFLIGEAIYYNEECPSVFSSEKSFLNLEQ